MSARSHDSVMRIALSRLHGALTSMCWLWGRSGDGCGVMLAAWELTSALIRKSLVSLQ